MPVTRKALSESRCAARGSDYAFVWGVIIPMTSNFLRVLGSAEFVASGQRQKFPDKGFQLLSFLSLAPARRATRRQLADLLWDSTDNATALANLRQLVVRIRRFPVIEAMFGVDAVA